MYNKVVHLETVLKYSDVITRAVASGTRSVIKVKTVTLQGYLEQENILESAKISKLEIELYN
jgi:hypothetical protein